MSCVYYDPRYELPNHLGNVLAVVSDRKKGIDENADGVVDYYVPDVIQAQDYSPFGMELVGRTYTSTGPQTYRYGFNGKEQDADVMGQGNVYDYGFRIYNPRIGRFLSVDPLTKEYPMLTPYQFASNTPIQAIDLDGLERLQATFALGFTFAGGKPHMNGGIALGLSTDYSDVQPSNNLALNLYNGGLGTSPSSENPFVAELVVSPTITMGSGNGRDMPIRTLHSQSFTAISSSIRNSFSFSSSWVFNLTDMSQNQRVGSWTVRSDNFSLQYYNDHWSGITGDLRDRNWSGGLNFDYLMFNGNLISGGTEVHTGEAGGLREPKMGSNGRMYETLSPGGLMRTFGRTYFGMTIFRGPTLSLEHSGRADMWSQNLIHDNISKDPRLPSIKENKFGISIRGALPPLPPPNE